MISRMSDTDLTSLCRLRVRNTLRRCKESPENSIGLRRSLMPENVQVQSQRRVSGVSRRATVAFPGHSFGGRLKLRLQSQRHWYGSMTTTLALPCSKLFLRDWVFVFSLPRAEACDGILSIRSPQ